MVKDVSRQMGVVPQTPDRKPDVAKMTNATVEKHGRRFSTDKSVFDTGGKGIVQIFKNILAKLDTAIQHMKGKNEAYVLQKVQAKVSQLRAAGTISTERNRIKNSVVEMRVICDMLESAKGITKEEVSALRKDLDKLEQRVTKEEENEKVFDTKIPPEKLKKTTDDFEKATDGFRGVKSSAKKFEARAQTNETDAKLRPDFVAEMKDQRELASLNRKVKEIKEKKPEIEKEEPEIEEKKPEIEEKKSEVIEGDYTKRVGSPIRQKIIELDTAMHKLVKVAGKDLIQSLGEGSARLGLITFGKYKAEDSKDNKDLAGLLSTNLDRKDVNKALGQAYEIFMLVEKGLLQNGQATQVKNRDYVAIDDEFPDLKAAYEEALTLYREADELIPE